MVYVDDSKHPYKGMMMCHMIADSLEELHHMARLLRLRKFFQDKPGKPHYDLGENKRAKAIELGAKEISEKELVTILKEKYHV